MIPGDYVDIYQKAGQNNPGPGKLLYKKARVVATVDSNGKQVAPGNSANPVAGATGSAAAVAVGVEIPDGQAAAIVGPASQNQIYLVKSAV